MPRRTLALAVIVAACVLGAGGYVVVAALGDNRVSTDARPHAAGARLADADLMVRAVDPDDPFLNGRVFRVRDGRPERRSAGRLACQRVYYAAGNGLCLAAGRSGVGFEAIVFDGRLRRRHRLELPGLPDRARVSRDGSLGAMTVFVHGHSYAGSGDFSTRTAIVDMRSGREIAELEEFQVERDGERIHAPDFNFWGVTFTRDPNRFYATLRTGGEYLLIEGNVRERTARVLRDRVECPSLSPDGKRIAYKSRIGHSDRWRVHVLDLSTLSDHPVAEKRSIDDQVEWLDDHNLVYSNLTDVFTVPADGGGEARRLLRGASSPAALRAG